MNEPISDISFLNRAEIDPIRWDQCIQASVNGLIYARSVYLDKMAAHWSALIWRDYEIVMPLPWNKKMGVSYLYQPAFTAQLGLFFKQDPLPLLAEEFIGACKARFRFCEMALNFANEVEGTSPRANYVLNLNRSYGEIRRGYKKRLLENLGEAEVHQLDYQADTDYSSTIQLFKKQYAVRMPQVRPKDYERFEELCLALHQHNMVFARQVRDRSGELLNTSIFFRDDKRIYNIMSVSLPLGREKRAHFYLLDRLITEFAQCPLLLDFEGSQLPGVAEFYRKFGSLHQPYPFLRYNHLPFLLRLFK